MVESRNYQLARKALIAVFGEDGKTVEFEVLKSDVDAQRFLEVRMTGNLPVGKTDELKIFLTRLNPYLIIDLKTHKIHEGETHLEPNLERGENVKAFATL